MTLFFTVSYKAKNAVVLSNFDVLKNVIIWSNATRQCRFWSVALEVSFFRFLF